MLQTDFIKHLSRKAAGLYPVAEGIRQELENRLYQLMQSSFDTLNLVTREELDTQLAVLERAGKRIAALEEQVAMLEEQLQSRQIKDDGQLADN